MKQKPLPKVYYEIDNFKYILVKTNEQKISYLRNTLSLNLEDSIYESVRTYFRFNPERAKNYEYVLGAVYDKSIGYVIKGVYKIKEWKLANCGNRYEFIKDDNADENIIKHFINKRGPKKYTQIACICTYHD